MSCSSSDVIKPDPTETINAGYKFFKIANNEKDSIMLALWYPTYDKELEYNYNTASTGLLVKGKVSYNASEINKNHPVIIFSHGFSGGGIGSIEICESLARAGYYVFVPDHNDAVMSVRIQGQSNGTLQEALEYLSNNPFENGENYEYRISELKSTIEFVNSSVFNIDKQNISLGGHSMGAWTVMKVLENRFSPNAMFLFSMGELNWLYSQKRYFEADFFQDFNFPTAYFYGGAEYGQAVAAGLGNVYAAYCFTYSPSPSYGLLVKEGNHFTYNSQAVAPGSYGSQVQLQSINSRLINFLNRYVRGMNITVTNEPEDVKK
ncbi:MAG: hypothetical protein M9949_06625 [Candidatus Kapabacteria bacterium]|nr:hypothetical protein [Candidatus Kapabacteria bacterium]